MFIDLTTFSGGCMAAGFFFCSSASSSRCSAATAHSRYTPSCPMSVLSSRMHTYVIISLYSCVCVCVFRILTIRESNCVKQMCCQMGSSFKSAVFADDVADNLRGWADGARRRVRRSATGVDASCLGTPAAAGRGWEGAAGWRLIAGRPSRPTQQPRSISF